MPDLYSFLPVILGAHATLAVAPFVPVPRVHRAEPW